jgi:hypothetical protein
MKTKREAVRFTTFHASQIKPPSKADLLRLKRASEGPIDTSDIPEQRNMKRHGPIWHAIADGMRQQGLSGHGLWKRARAFCAKMPESAVYEFLADKRSVRVEYADAMLQALGVRLLPSRRRRAG